MGPNSDPESERGSAAGLPVESAVLVERACDAFEAAWRAGARPGIEAAVAALPAAVRAAAAGELIGPDAYYRRAAGESPAADDYAGRFPDVGAGWLARALGAGEAETGGHGATGTRAGARGDYELLAEVGRGAMGVVFRATDNILGREVAVKVLADRFAPDSAAARRFTDEARIAGRLQHPGIPAVHDLGILPDGRPFLAMRLVQGRTLADLLKDRPDPAHDRGRFLAVFEQVAQAVGFAHSRGVIHRDLKPANVMVGEFGEVQVMDWGLAKELKGAGGRLPMEWGGGQSSIGTLQLEATRTGSVLGTPAFMPPEQAGGEVERVDERADVFGLGTILCVSLTGQPPYVAEAAEAVRLMAVRGDLADGFARLDRCGADAGLIALCKRCLAPDRDDRPRDAGVVADAVAAHLADVEGRARRAEVARAEADARAAEERKRRRVQLGLAAAVGLLIVGGLVGTGIALAAVERQRVRTADERDGKDRALQAETRARALAMRSLRDLTDRMVERRLARQPVLTAADRRFLRDIQRQYEEFAALSGDGVEQRAVRAEGFARVGGLRHRLGEAAEAEAALRQALGLYGPLAADFPNRPEFGLLHGQTLIDLCDVLRSAHRLPEAQTACDEALAVLTALGEDREARLSLAAARVRAGKMLEERGRPADAEIALRNAVSILTRLRAEDPERPAFDQELANTLIDLGILLKDTGRPDEADDEYQKAVVACKRLVARSPEEPAYQHSLAAVLNNQGLVRVDARRAPEAVAPYAEAIKLFKQLAADFPAVPSYRHDLAAAHHNLGDLLSDLKRPDQAEASYGEALKIYQTLADGFRDRPDFRRNLARTHNSLGVLFGDTNRPQQAVAAYTAALAIYQQLVADLPEEPGGHNDLAGTLGNLGGQANRRREFAEARCFLEEALPHNRAALMANSTHPGYRQFFRNNLVVLTQACGGTDDRAAATAAAALLRDLGWDAPALHAYDAACALALCIPLTDKQGKERQERAQFYADRSMELLRDAVGKGFDDPDQLRDDTDLNPLRGRDDFRRLAADLAGRSKTKQPGPKD
jgi:tetratricopeptide (TPR) repeat protein